MDVSATYNSEIVNFVDVTVNGTSIYSTFVDGNGNLKVAKDFLVLNTSATTLATSATVN